MPSVLSADLRERVVVAIEAGASRREAARRFKISPASAVHLYAAFVREGRTRAKPMGGDQRGHAAEQDREDLKAARLAWFEGQPDLVPDKVVFLDKTATNTKMARRYGWAPRGKRCRVAVPFGRWKTITVTTGLRTSGLTASALFNGTMTGVRFRRYVEEPLVPALNQGDTVVLDNLPAHKVCGIRERIEAAGARLLYLRV